MENSQENSCQTLKELSEIPNVDEVFVNKRLKVVEINQELGNVVSYDLKETDMTKRLTIREIAASGEKWTLLLHRIVTGDEKWVCYFVTVILSARNHGNIPENCQRQNRVGMLVEKRFWCEFCEVKSIWYFIRCQNHVKLSNLNATVDYESI